MDKDVTVQALFPYQLLWGKTRRHLSRKKQVEEGWEKDSEREMDREWGGFTTLWIQHCCLESESWPTGGWSAQDGPWGNQCLVSVWLSVLRRFEGNSAYAPVAGWPKFYLSTSACPNWCPTTRGKLRKPALPLEGSIPLSAGALPVMFPAWVVQDNTSPLMVLDDAPLPEHTEILQNIMQAVSVKRLPKILESSNL